MPDDPRGHGGLDLEASVLVKVYGPAALLLHDMEVVGDEIQPGVIQIPLWYYLDSARG